MPVFRAIKQWMAGQPAASPGLLYNLLMMVRLEHLQGDALHLLLQDELVRADVQCSQLVAHAALQIAGTATDHFPCRPVRSLAQVQIQVGAQSPFSAVASTVVSNSAYHLRLNATVLNTPQHALGNVLYLQHLKLPVSFHWCWCLRGQHDLCRICNHVHTHAHSHIHLHAFSSLSCLHHCVCPAEHADGAGMESHQLDRSA